MSSLSSPPSECNVRQYDGDTNRAACLTIFDSNTPAFFDPTEREEFATFLDDQRERYFVVEQAGAVVACGGWGWRAPRRVALLCWGMVHRDHHRRGIGTLLLTHRLGEIANQGFDEIEIVTSQNTAPFFALAGFVEVEVEPNLFAQGLHGHRMRRALPDGGR